MLLTIPLFITTRFSCERRDFHANNNIHSFRIINVLYNEIIQCTIFVTVLPPSLYSLSSYIAKVNYSTASYLCMNFKLFKPIKCIPVAYLRVILCILSH